MYANLPTSQGYIFRILQHFATKLCSFSNFDNFFPEISFVIPRLKIFLKRKSSIVAREFGTVKLLYRDIIHRSLKPSKCNKTYIMLNFVMKTLEFKVFLKNGGMIFDFSNLVVLDFLATFRHLGILKAATK